MLLVSPDTMNMTGMTYTEKVLRAFPLTTNGNTATSLHREYIHRYLSGGKNLNSKSLLVQKSILSP